MAYVRTIEEGDAEGELRAAYAMVKDASGSVANILKAESLLPRTLSAHYSLYRELMYEKSPLTRAQRELIAVAVSQANSCHY